MAYYVRKIARAKWKLLDNNSTDTIENYKADTIANDIRTTDNKISLWKAEDLSEKALEPVIVINSLLGDAFSRMQLIIIPEKLLEDFSIEQEDGDTVVDNYKDLHYNILNLTVKKHIQFAQDVILKILKDEETANGNLKSQTFIRQYSVNDQLLLVKKWIDANEFKLESLKKEQQEKYKKWIYKNN